jgi:hypothetical protein
MAIAGVAAGAIDVASAVTMASSACFNAIPGQEGNAVSHAERLW